MATDVLLGIDDTDVLGHRPGTGRLARDLAEHLVANGLVRANGVIRHQLLVDPRIPYTSHNSPACVLLTIDADNRGAAFVRVSEAAAQYVADRSAGGADPGLCMVGAADVPDDVVAFGWRTSSDVVTKDEARALAERHGITLRELGGTGDGIIGALAAVGLTADGNAGRFLELAGGLRDLEGVVPASTLRTRGLTLLSTSRNGEIVPQDVLVDTGNWVRPRLVAGRPVLLVEPTPDGWRCFDRKGHHGAHEPES